MPKNYPNFVLDTYFQNQPQSKYLVPPSSRDGTTDTFGAVKNGLPISIPEQIDYVPCDRQFSGLTFDQHLAQFRNTTQLNPGSPAFFTYDQDRLKDLYRSTNLQPIISGYDPIFHHIELVTGNSTEFQNTFNIHRYLAEASISAVLYAQTKEDFAKSSPEECLKAYQPVQVGASYDIKYHRNSTFNWGKSLMKGVSATLATISLQDYLDDFRLPTNRSSIKPFAFYHHLDDQSKMDLETSIGLNLFERKGGMNFGEVSYRLAKWFLTGAKKSSSSKRINTELLTTSQNKIGLGTLLLMNVNPQFPHRILGEIEYDFGIKATYRPSRKLGINIPARQPSNRLTAHTLSSY